MIVLSVVLSLCRCFHLTYALGPICGVVFISLSFLVRSGVFLVVYDMFSGVGFWCWCGLLDLSCCDRAHLHGRLKAVVSVVKAWWCTGVVCTRKLVLQVGADFSWCECGLRCIVLSLGPERGLGEEV